MIYNLYKSSTLKRGPNMKNNALIYCEGLFGESDGKVANGLISFSDKHQKEFRKLKASKLLLIVIFFIGLKLF